MPPALALALGGAFGAPLPLPFFGECLTLAPKSLTEPLASPLQA